MKIISGGQTGADQGALLAARELGIETGGWAPKGWRTEEGPSPWLADYGLKQSSSADYIVRTRSNILMAEATVIFGKESVGSRATWNYASSIPNYKVHWAHLPPWEMGSHATEELAIMLVEWAGEIKTLNVAGNRESVSPGIRKTVKDVMSIFLAAYL